MTELLRTWILGLTAAAMITSIAMTVTPEGRVKKVTALVCGLAVMIMLIKPVIGFDYEVYAKSLVKGGGEIEGVYEKLSEKNENLTGLIIEQACTAYILDKGQSLGIHGLEAAVSAKRSEDGNWYPCSVKLKANADKDLRDKLGLIITTELGIPPEELIWSMNDDE